MSAVTVTVSGPLFDGRAVAAGHDLTQAVVDRVAYYAIERVQANLDASIRNPTPYYETQIQITNMGTDRSVNDRGIVYGPWIEGIGSRNQTTRFKGYASFRRAHQATERAVPSLAEPIVAQYVQRMGG